MMLELKITAKITPSESEDIIGIKEDLIYRLEKWAFELGDISDVKVNIEIPKQITLSEHIEHSEISVDVAIEEVKKRNLSVQEMRNFIQAFIELTRIDREENYA